MQRVVFDDVTQLRQRFPILDKTRPFIPTLIDMFKAHGITSLFIADVDDFNVSEYNTAYAIRTMALVSSRIR